MMINIFNKYKNLMSILTHPNVPSALKHKRATATVPHAKDMRLFQFPEWLVLSGLILFQLLFNLGAFQEFRIVAGIKTVSITG